MIERLRRTTRALPDKKRYFEFITALLSVPVLITVLISNVRAIKSDESEKPTPTTIIERVAVIPQTSDKQSTKTNSSSESDSCKKEVGPVTIAFPDENDTVTDNPVMFDINYDDTDYCAVIWSYRINDGKWSEYDDSSIALYNLPNGDITFDLRVKSIASGQVKTLSRNFVYNGTPIPTPTLTDPTPSSASAK